MECGEWLEGVKIVLSRSSLREMPTPVTSLGLQSGVTYLSALIFPIGSTLRGCVSVRGYKAQINVDWKPSGDVW